MEVSFKTSSSFEHQGDRAVIEFPEIRQESRFLIGKNETTRRVADFRISNKSKCEEKATNEIRTENSL